MRRFYIEYRYDGKVYDMNYSKRWREGHGKRIREALSAAFEKEMTEWDIVITTLKKIY